VDARRAPRWVLSNHPEDQLSNLLRGLFSRSWRPDFRDQLPIQAESGPVPPDDRFRGDDNEVLLPAGPNSPSNYPEELIKETENRPRTAPLQHSKLLPKREIFQDEMPRTYQASGIVFAARFLKLEFPIMCLSHPAV
jgi:hypothetical protein